jgi:SAM-dependent MidA family methyltransferase
LNPLPEIIRDEIAKSGAISFHRFMELALYCPDYGFYEKEKDIIGRRGNFYTSVSVGPLFGQMLAFQFAEWSESVVGQKLELRIVEAGAHDGKLAADILKWLRECRAEIFSGLQYVLVEPSPRRRQWQKQTLAGFENRIIWLNEISELNNGQSDIGHRKFTIIFSNELLDAFPVHRVGWDAKDKIWFEWGVASDQNKFVWTKLKIQNSKQKIPTLPSELLEVLPDNFTTEVCPAAESWWRTAAENLQRGKLLTFDYGLTEEEFFWPERAGGTLRSYTRHHISNDLLAEPGEQDITAHVNFSALQAAGEAAGLTTEAFVSQTKFLTGIAEQIWRAPERFGSWLPAHNRRFQTLTHPEHLGRSFRALAQSRAW